MNVFPFFAYPRESLGLVEGQPFILCLDDPFTLPPAAWDVAARVAAVSPHPALVFCVPHAVAANRGSREDLRAAVGAAFALHETALERCVVCAFDHKRDLCAALLPHAACVLSLEPSARQYVRMVETREPSSGTAPFVDAALTRALRVRLRVPESEKGIGEPAVGDAVVELALNLAAQSPYGQELAPLTLRCAAFPASGPADDEGGGDIQPPLLIDLAADEDALIDVTLETPEGRSKNFRTKGLDLRGQVDAFYGRHRSGWAYATDILRHIHNPSAPYFETFLERRFSWGAWMGEKLGPILKPWIGIVHVPLVIPPWYGQDNVFTVLSEKPSWKLSAPYCRGLFTLSRSLKESLSELAELRHLPIDVLTHPTEFVSSTWSAERFARNANRALVQIGTTYRNLHGIHNVPPGPYRKWVAMGGSAASFQSLYTQEEEFLLEHGTFQPGADAHTTYLEFLSDEAYDALFTEHIIFIEYYAVSATNLVLECIARNTPILVNPLPAIVEYLGEAYPLYYTTYQEAGAKASSDDVILSAHNYLAAMDKSRFTREYFLESILDSAVYKECVRQG